MYRLLVCDLDGTLLGDDPSLRRLLQFLRAPGAPVLAFASGRQGYSAMTVLSEWDVTHGAYLIAGVGTEIYRRLGRRWVSVGAWPQLQAPWDGSRARRRLARVNEIRPQRISAHSAYKLSYVAAPAALPRVFEALHEEGVDATVVHSHGNLLDVLPPGIDKGSAVSWLARRLAVPLEAVMTCGNTTNDLAMLALPCPSVVVGGCDDDLRLAAPELTTTYFAQQRCAGGIIEGLRHFGWLNERGWQ